MYRTAAVVFLCLLLSSCSFSRTVETDEAGVRSRYETLETAQMRVEISAEFPDRVSTYLVDYQYHRGGDNTITVIEPSSIAGVVVTVKDGDTFLSVGEMKLETGRLDESGLTPISALPRLMRVWASQPSEIESVREGGEGFLLLVYEDGTTTYRTLFSRETYHPVRAEIYSEGECVLRLQYAV